jgi:spermidine/putrescine transport system permease protein
MNKLIQSTYLAAIYAFLYIPIAVVIFFSFNNTQYSLLWKGFSTQWYTELFHDKNLADIALHSLTVGVCAATAAAIIGLITSVTLFRYKFFGKRPLDLLLLTLIITPDIVVGIALLLLFTLGHFPIGFWSLLLAHISFCVPFCVVTISAAIVTLNKNIVEAAQDLGASEFTIFMRILAPLLLPSLIAAWLLSFTLSIDDVVISYFVSGPSYQILPLHIYAMVKMGVSPEINALCTLLVAVTMLLVFVSQMLLQRKK